MPLKNQDSVAASAFFAFCSLSVLYLSSRTLTGRTVLLWLRLHVWVSWLPMVMVMWAYKGLYAVFFILCTTAIDFISLSCDLCEVLLKKYHSILAQCQATLSVAFVLLRQIYVAGAFLQQLYYILFCLGSLYLILETILFTVFFTNTWPK